MSGAANTAFLARHLLRSEFPRGEFTEAPGVCHVADDAAWLGVLDPAAVVDPEATLKAAQAFAAARQLPWAGVVMFTSATSVAPPEVDAIEEALYIYGFPRAKGLNRGGPDMVQIVPNDHRLSPQPRVEMRPAAQDMDAASQLFAVALETSDRITGPAWNRSKAWIERAEPYIAYRDFEPAGLLSYVPGDLIGRVVMLVVADGQRGHGVGRDMLSFAQGLGADNGAPFTSIWNFREGRLRYYISKLGFAEQLGARYFLAGTPH